MNANQPFAALEAKVRPILTRLTRPGDRLLLAVSGGSDSVGLMHISALLAQKLDIDLAVGFVNHGLRDGVEREFEFVEDQARMLGIPVHYTEIPKEEASLSIARRSIQEWAREARYRLLIQIAEQFGAKYIATGHTLDDQAETVLLRLVRGTGLDGLAGIPVQRGLNSKISVIRPLLRIARQDIRTYLTVGGIGWVDDPSNENRKFSRVRVRKELLPLMNDMQSGVKERLAALADDASHVSDFMEKEYFGRQDIMENLRLSNGVRVDYQVFSDIPEGLWPEIIRLVLKRVRGNLRRIERPHIESIGKLIKLQKSTEALALPGQVAVYVHDGSLYVFPGPLSHGPTEAGEIVPLGDGLYKIHSKALGATVELRGDKGEPVLGLKIRTRRPGDRLWGSKRKLKKVLAEARIPRPYRDFFPLLVEGKEIVSCPSLVESRKPELTVNWKIDASAPILDIDFVE